MDKRLNMAGDMRRNDVEGEQSSATNENESVRQQDDLVGGQEQDQSQPPTVQPNPSSNANRRRGILPRFHQPLRGALGGLGAFFGRGEDKKMTKEGETKSEKVKSEEAQKERETQGQQGSDGKEVDGPRGKQGTSAAGRTDQGQGAEHLLKQPIPTADGASSSSALADESTAEEENTAGGKGTGDEGGGTETDEQEMLEPVNKAKETPEANGGEGGSRKTEPKRRLRRGSSVVHPLGGLDGQVDSGSRTSGKMFSARLPEPSRPSQWVYVQLADRSFKRMTEEELQREQAKLSQQEQQQKGMGEIGPPRANVEFGPVGQALATQMAFHWLALALQGFLSGLAFGHSVFAFLFVFVDLPPVPSLLIISPFSTLLPSLSKAPPSVADEFSSVASGLCWLALPAQALFHLGLAIALVDALDSFHISSSFFGTFLRRSLLSRPSLAILAWFGAFLASISSVQLDEYFVQGSRLAILQQTPLLVALWRWLSAVRAGCALVGWLLAISMGPERNETAQSLRRMAAQTQGTPQPLQSCPVALT